MLPAIVFISFVIAVAPMIGMVFFIWWIDRYDREPLRYLFGSFFWGALGAFIISVIGSELSLEIFGELSPEREIAIGTTVVAPIVEEAMKGAVLFLLLRFRDFDNVTDGLVYGAAAGLGFGMTENFFYFIGYARQQPIEEWLNLLFIRSVFTAYMHSAATATFGAGVSRLKNSGWGAIFSVICFYIIAVVLHAGWNTLLRIEKPETGGLAILLLLLYFGIIFLLFVIGIRKERRQREKLLEEEFAAGILPSNFKKILFSYRAMRKGNWFPAYLNKDKYLSLVSRLVMHRSAYTRASENRRKILDGEITEIRQELKRFSDLIVRIPE
jgi:RsiW-degrading membrane proteinase PrsW (M82 family)